MGVTILSYECGFNHQDSNTNMDAMGWLRLVGPLNYTYLLQNIVSFIGLFRKRDL